MAANGSGGPWGSYIEDYDGQLHAYELKYSAVKNLRFHQP
jgi:hypothetical protein